MSDHNIPAHWLAEPSQAQTPVSSQRPLATSNRLASMEKQLAEFMRTVEKEDDDASPPRLMSGHRDCPCCTERGN